MTSEPTCTCTHMTDEQLELGGRLVRQHHDNPLPEAQLVHQVLASTGGAIVLPHQAPCPLAALPRKSTRSTDERHDMGTSTDGILAYGYDLGDDFGFEYDDKNRPAWMDNDDESYAETAWRMLLNANGFTETYGDGHANYFRRERAAEEALGLKLVFYCSGEASMYILAVKEIRAHRGEALTIDLSVPGNANERLQWALDVLGVKPKADKPQWLLASYWG